jgi:hypothetical protein
VVDHPLMAPYLRQMLIRVIPFAELKSELLAKYAIPRMYPQVYHLALRRSSVRQTLATGT